MRNKYSVVSTLILLLALLVAALGRATLPRSDTAPALAQSNAGSIAPTEATGLAGPPSPPASFYGIAAVDGADVVAGTQVSAWIGATRYAQSHATLYQGRPFYAFNVPADDPTTPAVEGGRAGDTVVFTIGEARANETAVWQGGTNRRLDLTTSRPPPCSGTGDTNCSNLIFLSLVKK